MAHIEHEGQKSLTVSRSDREPAQHQKQEGKADEESKERTAVLRKKAHSTRSRE